MRKYLVVFIVFFSVVSNVLFSQKNNSSTTKEHSKLFDFLTKLDNSSMQDEKRVLKKLDSIKPILEQKADYSLLGFYYRIHSDVCLNKLDNVSAKKDIEQSILYFTKDNNQKGIVLSTLNKGNIFFLKGDLKNAMQVYTNGLIIAQKNNFLYESALLTKNIGLIFFNQEKIDEALNYNRKSLAVFVKLNKKNDVAATYTNIGNCFYEKYDAKNALINYKKALFISAEVKDTVNLAKLYNNIGTVYIDDEKDTIKGLNYLLHSLDLKKKFNDQEDLIFQYNNIANLYTNQKKYDLAERYLEKSYAMAKKSGSKSELREVFEIYSLIYAGKKDYKKAYDYHILYTKVKDTLLNIDNLKAVEEIKTKYKTAEKEKQLLQKEIEIKNSRNRLIAVSSIAFFIGILGFLIYRQQRLKNMQQKQEFQLKSAIAQIENQNKLHEQRLLISRDLHDNIGAQLTFVISSVDNLKFGNTITDSKINNQLTKISDFTKSTIVELRDTIWAMNTSEFTIEDLYARILNFIEKAKSAKDNINFKFVIDDQLKEFTFSSVIGINLYRTIQEAINNAIKYSEAKDIVVEVKKDKTQIKIVIHDNGKGFDIENTEYGNGLYNMKKRMEEVNGTCNIQSILNEGTTITILLTKNQSA